MRARNLLLSAAAVLAASGLGVSAATAKRAASPRCTTSQLAGAIIDEDAGAGNRNARLILTNTSSTTCHTKGYIGGQLVSAAGSNLPTVIARDTSATPKTVVIRPGAAGAVKLHWTVIPSGNHPCPKARYLRVTPPDETTTLQVFFGDTACEGHIDAGPVTRARLVS